MKALTLLIALVTLFAGTSMAQTEIKLDNKRFSENWFNDIDKAAANPDKVWYLDLSLQKLKEFPKDILAFKNLKELYLPVNYWPGVPNEIGSLKNLEILDLSSNYYMNTLPEGLAELENLKELHIKDNKLNAGEVEKAKKWLPNAEVIYK